MQLGEVIWYMMENRPHSARILAIMRVDNLHEDTAHTAEQKKLFTPFGNSGVWYGTCHGIIEGGKAYTTKEEMVTAIMEG